MDAIRRLAAEGSECCRFYRMITDATSMEEVAPAEGASDSGISDDGLNDSQREAVRRTQQAQVSLVWGPPGWFLRVPSMRILDLT
jgi:regulator of nonsense transcripts 1